MAAKDKSQKTEVAVQTAGAVMSAEAAALWQADAGIGRESMSVQDMALPYFTLLQSLSPQVKKSSPTRVDGAEEGDIFNTVTQELFGGEEGLTVIPCAFQKAWVEWAPRDSGGGFVASHADDTILQSCTRNEAGFDIRQDNGNLIVATFYYYVMRLKDDGGYEFGIVSMARTALKKARKWNSIMSSLQVAGPHGPFNPPMFAQKFLLNAVPETNPKGDYYNWNVKFLELVNDAGVYGTAKKFAESVRSGAVKVSAPPSAESTTHDDDGPF